MELKSCLPWWSVVLSHYDGYGEVVCSVLGRFNYAFNLYHMYMDFEEIFLAFVYLQSCPVWVHPNVEFWRCVNNDFFDDAGH